MLENQGLKNLLVWGYNNVHANLLPRDQGLWENTIWSNMTKLSLSISQIKQMISGKLVGVDCSKSTVYVSAVVRAVTVIYTGNISSKLGFTIISSWPPRLVLHSSSQSQITWF